MAKGNAGTGVGVIRAKRTDGTWEDLPRRYYTSLDPETTCRIEETELTRLLTTALDGLGRDGEIPRMVEDLMSFALFRAFERQQQEEAKRKPAGSLGPRLKALLKALAVMDGALSVLTVEDTHDLLTLAVVYWHRLQPDRSVSPLNGRPNIISEETSALRSSVKALDLALRPIYPILSPRRRKGRPASALRADYVADMLLVLDQFKIPPSHQAGIISDLLYSAGFATPERVDLLVSRARSANTRHPRPAPKIEHR
ncbi:MAG: hypothetical protein K1Y01_21875 [Vicinamibacteria bacterium]|nr:hypothetical protein [Vicinamibacteria bacterium]